MSDTSTTKQRFTGIWEIDFQSEEQADLFADLVFEQPKKVRASLESFEANFGAVDSDRRIQRVINRMQRPGQKESAKSAQVDRPTQNQENALRDLRVLLAHGAGKSNIDPDMLAGLKETKTAIVKFFAPGSTRTVATASDLISSAWFYLEVEPMAYAERRRTVLEIQDDEPTEDVPMDNSEDEVTPDFSEPIDLD